MKKFLRGLAIALILMFAGKEAWAAQDNNAVRVFNIETQCTEAGDQVAILATIENPSSEKQTFSIEFFFEESLATEGGQFERNSGTDLTLVNESLEGTRRWEMPWIFGVDRINFNARRLRGAVSLNGEVPVYSQPISLPCLIPPVTAVPSTETPTLTATVSASPTPTRFSEVGTGLAIAPRITPVSRLPVAGQGVGPTGGSRIQIAAAFGLLVLLGCALIFLAWLLGRK